jgi:hypothetical protein
MAAMSACLDRWEVEYPSVYDPSGEMNGGYTELGVIEFDRVDFDKFGYFYIEQPHPHWPTQSKVHVACRGNIKKKTIGFVSLNDVIKRPKAVEDWSFK